MKIIEYIMNYSVMTLNKCTLYNYDKNTKTFSYLDFANILFVLMKMDQVCLRHSQHQECLWKRHFVAEMTETFGTNLF
jgi:hypothetical protein